MITKMLTVWPSAEDMKQESAELDSNAGGAAGNSI